MENMLDLMEEPLEIKDVPNALELIPSKGKIEFKNVSFSYQPERQILKNINFEINAGETIGIVGPTGRKYALKIQDHFLNKLVIFMK